LDNSIAARVVSIFVSDANAARLDEIAIGSVDSAQESATIRICLPTTTSSATSLPALMVCAYVATN
jgi:hypothetical protein